MNDASAGNRNLTRAPTHRLRVPRAIVVVSIAIAFGAQARAGGPHHQVTFSNHGNHTIDAIYIKATKANGWGSNRIDPTTLGNGVSISWEFDGTCVQDLKIVYDDAKSKIVKGFDTCKHPWVSTY